MNTTPYTFTIKNTCTTFISYDVIFLVDSESTLGTQYVDVVLDRNVIKTLDQYESREIDNQTGYILQSGSLSREDEITYNLRMWLDEEVTVNDPVFNTSLKGKIRIEAKITNYSPIDQGFNKLADAMLVNEYQSSSVEAAKDQIESKQAPDFSKTAPIINWNENHASTTTTASATMPHPDLVNNGEDYTKNLTNENILPRIGTSYTFNLETGQYTIGNLSYVDPTTLNYKDSETKYYFCASGFSMSSTGVVSTWNNYANCTTIYELTGAVKEEKTAGDPSIKAMSYRMTAYAYTQSEQESDKSDKGLYMMEDGDSKSYYYRGSVNNNYVYFAGYYWRIIRQNSDGSIRLLYAGETPNATGNDLNMKLTDSSLGYTNMTTSPFNLERNNPGYVGYMYGNTFNSSYEETYANDNDSSIKKYLDSWYKQNIVDKGYSNYIADPGFCNDRSLSTTSDGDGVSLDYTHYGGYQRFYSLKTPSLSCPNESNDLFTTATNSMGNKVLIYPIGLITVDELILSGYADGYLNKLAYTYSSVNYWTMSPGRFTSDILTAYEFYFDLNGFVGTYWVTDSRPGVRGVINLKADTEISSGIGTANDPYVLS